MSEGTGQWIGGTGKVASLSGAMAIRSRRLNSLTDGAIPVMSEKISSDSCPDTVASTRPD